MDMELLWTLTILTGLLGILLGAGIGYALTRAHYQEIIKELRKKLAS